MRKYYITSEDNNHTHLWNPNARTTSYNNGHSHPISLKKMIASKGKSNHTHKLLKKEVKEPCLMI